MESLKVKLLEKLEQSLTDLQIHYGDISNALVGSDDPSNQNKTREMVGSTDHQVSREKISL